MKNKDEEPLWCKMFRKEVIKPKQRERLTEQIGRTRESQSGFYRSKSWKALRTKHISENPICVDCEKEGRLVSALIVDHIQPIDIRPDLALDPDNLQSLCSWHHVQKTNNDKRLRNKQKKIERGKKLQQKFESFAPGGGYIQK